MALGSHCHQCCSPAAVLCHYCHCHSGCSKEEAQKFISLTVLKLCSLFNPFFFCRMLLESFLNLLIGCIYTCISFAYQCNCACFVCTSQYISEKIAKENTMYYAISFLWACGSVAQAIVHGVGPKAR